MKHPRIDRSVQGFAAAPVGHAALGDRRALLAPPKAIPPGRTVALDDPSGSRVHVLDLSASR